LVQALNRAGYPIRRIAYEDWKAELMRVGQDAGSSLFALVPLFSERMAGESRSLHERFLFGELPSFDCTTLLTGITGSSVNCPPLDQSLFGAYFKHLGEIGFLAPLKAPQGA
jgi:hypothetical protein